MCAVWISAWPNRFLDTKTKGILREYPFLSRGLSSPNSWIVPTSLSTNAVQTLKSTKVIFLKREANLGNYEKELIYNEYAIWLPKNVISMLPQKFEYKNTIQKDKKITKSGPIQRQKNWVQVLDYIKVLQWVGGQLISHYIYCVN